MKMSKNKSTKENCKNEMTESVDQKIKPKFDKKKWRERKYSKKFKVAEWEKRHEKAVLKQYYKELKKDSCSQPIVNNVSGSSTSTDKLESSIKLSKQNKKRLNSYEAAKAEMRRIQEDRQKQKEERIRKKKEMDDQIALYKKKRADRYKVLSRKNNKGQPIMKGRLELLYDQIKQTVSS